jgi:hypothetical protein
MKKEAISVTLSADNLVWLRARSVAERNRSVSETLDRLVTTARSGVDGRPAAVRSVAGSVRIDDRDPDLSTADALVRDLFARSLTRTGAGDDADGARGADRVAERRRRG